MTRRTTTRTVSPSSHRTGLATPVALQAIAIAIAAVAAGSVTVLTDAAAQSPAAPVTVAAATTPTGTRYAADADMQAVLDALAAKQPKPIENSDVDTARRQPTLTDAVMAILMKQGKDASPTVLVPGVTSVDREIPGAAGPLPVRVYTPVGTGPFPVIVYFHGGGWVIADRNVYDGGARGLAKSAGAVVVSVDYRRAPENKFPAAWDDALAAYRWAATHAPQIKGDPARLALAGESAGGNLAVSTAVAARDAGVTAPRAVLAVYPVAQTGDMATESYVDSANAKPLNKAMVGWFVDKLLARPGDKADPRLDIVNAKLQGLPPVTIVNARIDPLRSDGELLQQALQRADVPVERKVYDGVTHEFFGAAAVVKQAQDAQAYAGMRLRQAFGSPAKAL